VILAEDEPLHGLVESRIAGGSDIGLRVLAREYGLFRLPDCLQNRRLPMVITINPHAQIDLMWVGIRAKGGHEAENRIGKEVFEPLEHRLDLHCGNATKT
jgi:hypothetical protein